MNVEISLDVSPGTRAMTLQLLLKFALTLTWIIPLQEVSYAFCDWERFYLFNYAAETPPQ